MATRHAHQSAPERFCGPIAEFVGRQHELASIWKQYEAARDDSMRIVLLTGEIGIGKTRLLQEIALRTRQDGATVLQGEATDAEGMPPYLPFLEALGQYIRMTPIDILREQIAPISLPLVDILPELAGRLGGLPDAYTFPPEQTRLRIYDAVGALLEAMSASHVLVLTLDDLHWADSASLDLLCHIARHRAQSRLLVVGAYLEGEIERNTALEQTMTRLARRRVLTTVTVPPLSAQEVEALAASYLGSPLAPAVSSLLYKQSEGNPFFAEEIMRSWLESSHLVEKGRQWVANAPLERALPQSIIGSLRQRFIHLSTEVIDDLRIAAVIGHIFDPSLLAMVEGQAFEAVEERLLQAERARLVVSDQKGAFMFRHTKIREVLYTEVSTSRRRRLHETIGRLLEVRYGQESAKNAYHLAELAFHFTQSDDRARAITYAQLAAERALQSFALEEAISYYRTALELLDGDDERRGKLLSDLGEAALLAGLDGEAEMSYRDALEWFERHGEGERAAHAAHGLGLAQWRQGKQQSARTTLEYAVKLLADAAGIEAIRVRIALATLLTVDMDQPDEGAIYAQQALQMARSESLLPELAHALVALADVAQARATQESIVQGQSYLKEAQALFEQLGLTEASARVRSRLAPNMRETNKDLLDALPANLTQREAEVLRLVARGMSNRQIAHELKLSTSTVANHLAHIFSKTGSENRVAATTFAMKYGLI